MRKVTAGNGTDSTSAVLAYLKGNNHFTLANLYLIGEPEDPMALWLTDYESPLAWPCWGTFQPSVIKRGTVKSNIGLEVQSLDVNWTPANKTFTQSVATASPYQLAQLGYYDNWKVRVWTVYMPTPGDANTYGASELFGGRVADTTVVRGQIQWKVNSFLDVVNQYVPTNVVELQNTGAGYTGATKPTGYSRIPQFNVITGSSINAIVGDETFPTAHDILGTNVVRGGFLVFNSGVGATLAGLWSPILQNVSTGGPTPYNQFVLSVPLPWPPTAGVDTFYVSAAAPINQADGSYQGFPYVPAASLGF